MPKTEITFNLHPRQGSALQTKANEILYGGAAGGGKSYLMRVAAIIWCAAIPGLQVYLFRRISLDLIKNHMEGPKGFRNLLAPLVANGDVSMLENEIRFKNGSRIYLCHCKDEKDRFKYQGAEIHVLMIDELTHFSEVIYRFLRSRVRAVGLNIPPQFERMFPRILCGSNPGNIGHHWVKSFWIDPVPSETIWTTDPSEGGMQRIFIPAKLEDNPSMEMDDPSYEARLLGLGSPALVKAMREGDWSVIAGAYFPEFNPDLHVIKPFNIPDSWVRFRSFDWGSSAPFSCGWWTVADGTTHLPRGALIRYREWYGALEPNVGLKLSIEEVAAGIAQRSYNEKFAYSKADPAIFKQDGGPSIAEVMHRGGVTFQPADNTRIPGWSQLRGRLKGQDGKPMIYFFDTCRDTIRTLPILQHDDHKPEDIDTDLEDHAADEVRYACMSRPWASKVEVKQPIRGIESVTINDLWDTNKRQQGGRI